MRSLLGRFHRPMSRGLVNNMLTMNNLGDGSTLSLDFTAMGEVLDPRLTFSRASTATFVNSQGYVEYAGANLFRSSNDLSGTNWTKQSLITPSAPSGIPAPSGSTTDITTVIPDTTNTSDHRIIQSLVLSSGLTYTISFYVKPNGYNFFYLFDNAAASPYALTFNLTTNTSISFSGGSNLVIGTPDAAGWRKISFTFVQQTASTSNTFIIRVHPDSNFTSFAGNGTSGILVWGFQINPGSTVQTYYPTTTAAYYAPRFDYSPTNIGEPRGLLVEGQAVNLARYSESLEITGGYWGYNAATRTVESSDVNPTNGTGSISFGPTSNGGSRYCGLFLTGQTTTTAYTFSAWIKAKGTSSAVVSIQNSAGAVNSTVTILSQPSGANASIAGNGGGFPRLSSLSSSGWTKIQVVTSSTLGGTGVLNVFVYPNDTSTQTTADTMFMWGAQLEAGSGASSYIPTGASQVTRNADSCVMTGTNFSSWFAGATEGVLFAEYEKPRSQSGNAAHDYSAVASKYNTGEGLIVYAGNSNFYPTNILWPTGGAIFAGGIATAIPSVTKQAAKWFAANDLTMYSNGVVGSTAAGTGTVTLAMLSFGANSNTGTEATRDWLNACVRRVKFYPTALSDAAIQTLTTP